MRDVWKILERQQLQAEIDEVEQTLKSIKCQRDILMEKGAKETIARIGDIYKELLRGGLSPEQKEKLMREKDELWEDPLYIEFRSYAEPSRKAFDKLFKAKRRLEELLAEEAAPTAPPAAIAPLPSGNAESCTPNSSVSGAGQLWGRFTGFFGLHDVHHQEKLKSM